MVTYDTRRVKKDSIKYQLTYVFVDGKLYCDQEQSLAQSDDYRYKYYEYEGKDIVRMYYTSKQGTWEDYSLSKDTLGRYEVVMKVNNERLVYAKLDKRGRITSLHNKPKPKEKNYTFTSIFGTPNIFTIDFNDSLYIEYNYGGLFKRRTSVVQEGDRYDQRYEMKSVRTQDDLLISEKVYFSSYRTPRFLVYKLSRHKKMYHFKNEYLEIAYKVVADNNIEVTATPMNGTNVVKYFYSVE